MPFFLGKESKRFPDPLPEEVVYNMDQRDFVDYCRNHLWDGIAQEKFGKTYEQLDDEEFLDVDMEALIRLARAMHQVHEENELQSRNRAE